MTATDELRAELTKRGVEWFESVTRKSLTWIYRDGKAIRFHPWQPDTLKVSMFDLTPEQAVAATLGRGTCHMAEMRFPHEDDGSYWLLCDQCGFMIYMRDWWQPVRFCSHCGRKVVDE